MVERKNSLIESNTWARPGVSTPQAGPSLFHPCSCISYNGKQCYNCLNGAHEFCGSKNKCKKRNSKHLGLGIVIVERRTK